MDQLLLWSIRVFFIIAAVAPLALVLRYRWREVPARRDDIIEVLDAFNRTEEGRKALADNPYMSDPRETFEWFHSPSRYVVPLTVLTALMAAGSYITYTWSIHQLAGTQPTPAPGIPERLPLVVIMALVGGMVWTLQQLMARVYDNELGPPDIQEISIGLFAAVPIGYAFSLITAELNQLRSFMAFAASAFPVREASRMIREFTTRKMLEPSPARATRPAERHLGMAIEGVSDEALARLAELRIVTALDMAYSDPVKIMVQTGFPLPVIIDWMDQAIWALYAGDKKSDLNRLGIRCSLDVCEFVDMHLRDDEKKKIRTLDGLKPDDRKALDAVAAKMEVAPELVMDLFFRIYNDPQVVVLRHLWYQGGVPPELTN